MDTRLLLIAIERWVETARNEVEDIGAWRGADVSDRVHLYWPTTTMPKRFRGDTITITVALVQHKLDVSPVNKVFEAVRDWHELHGDAQLPEQHTLDGMLESAVRMIQVVEWELVEAAHKKQGDELTSIKSKLEAKWSIEMSLKDMARLFDCDPRTLMANHGGAMRQISRQRWQIDINKVDSPVRTKITPI
jgi:hypothetical protein